MNSAVAASELRLALVGVPNCGKTALFNRLTGSHQKVANYAGVTVERKEGRFTGRSGRSYRILDLPGAYSLTPTSLDEAITRDAVLGRLAGEMPPEIEQAFQAAGVSLFPTRNEIAMSCSCPDWAVPCKHIAAVYYLLGEEFDRDPFLLLTLRGRTRDQVMAALRGRRAAAASPVEEAGPEEQPEPQVEPLDADLSRFWELRDGLGGFRVTIAPPPVETALLKRLGPPPFSRRPEAFVGALTLVYAAVTDRALALAFGEEQLANGELQGADDE